MSQSPPGLDTLAMNVRRVRLAESRRTKRVLLVGFPPLMLGGLEPAFSSVSEVLKIPPLILALTIQRYLVRGLSFGAVKA